MKIWIAEDEPVSRHLLETMLVKLGYELVTACGNATAWKSLQQEDAPPSAILDWMMSSMDGIEVCPNVRSTPGTAFTYVIPPMAKSNKETVMAVPEIGANDYITAALDPEEFRARL